MHSIFKSLLVFFSISAGAASSVPLSEVEIDALFAKQRSRFANITRITASFSETGEIIIEN